MLYKEHYLELYINGQKVDLESQKSLNLRFQNVLYDPEKISSTQAEYSFEFDLPATKNNNKIFDYANNLSKVNKFHSRWNAEVYADGTLIFKGTLTLNGYKDKMYNCNLVSAKVYSLEEIFGSAVLSDIPWEIPFDGAGSSGYSIDYYNSLVNTDVVFPLVSYGAFQKSPYNSDNTANDYTSKFDLDKYNRWYVESFYPSLNMLATVKKAFEYKGYTVGGDAFHDIMLKDIFMSTNLADSQSPEYNLGNPQFGDVDLSVTASTSGTGYQQELQFPYYAVYGTKNIGNAFSGDKEYNYKEIDIYDLLSEGSVTMTYPNRSSYMFQPNEHIIVIPADGFYKVDMQVSSTLNTSGSITASHYLVDMGNHEISEQTISLPVGFEENTPIEIHLVRNYDDNIELIKGKHNIRYYDGNPNHATYTVNSHTYNNIDEWVTCFPHEDPYNAKLPTEKNNLSLRNTTSLFGSAGTNPRFGRNTEGRGYSRSNLGYIYNDNELMCYDQAVSEAFICGFSSMYGGVASVMKNGYSWSSSNPNKNESFYEQLGYSFMKYQNNAIVTEQTSKNSNTYISSPTNYVTATSTSLNGSLSCIVYLKKNDILQLLGVHRGYDNISYRTTSTVNLKITAFSPKNYDYILANYENNYYQDSQFPYNLHLNNFLNKETKISDWIQSIADAYNLEIIQDGKNVFLNSREKLNRKIAVAVDIDDRVNSDEAETSRISYPKSMAVKYKIDTDEWGFEKSVYPPEKLNEEDWKDYGDSGFTVIKMNDDSYITNESNKNLQFSYTWYDNFNWYPVNSSFEQVSTTPTPLSIPVISKYSYMIDGYDYEESMKHDGYGLPQRFWFKPEATTSYVWTRTYPAEMVQIYKPHNMWTNNIDYLNLSYKVTEPSLLKRYFNITPYLASNYVTVELYLSPDEYKMIKNGAMVRFDSDLYIPVELSGYDPTNNDKTTLKMIKKL